MVGVAGQRWIGRDAWLGRNDGGDAALDDTDCTGGEVGHVTFEVGLRLLFAGGAAGLIGLGGGFRFSFGFGFFFLTLGAGLGFEDAEPAAGELAEAVGGARIHLALEHVVGDLFEELAHVVEGLERDLGRIGRQQGRVVLRLAAAVAHEAAVSMGGFSFLFLPGVVKKAVFLAGLGRGVAWASLVAGVVAARGVGVAIYFQKLWDFHIYSFNKAFSIQHSAFSQGHCMGDFFRQRAKRHLGTMMT